MPRLQNFLILHALIAHMCSRTFDCYSAAQQGHFAILRPNLRKVALACLAGSCFSKLCTGKRIQLRDVHVHAAGK